MAVGYGGVGAAAAGSTSLAGVPVPGTPAANDLLLCGIACKEYMRTPTTSDTGWSLLSDGTNGTVAASADAGSVRQSVFQKIAVGSDAALAVTITSGNVTLARMMRFTKGGGETWALTSTSASDSDTSSDTVSATGDDVLALATGDFLAVFVGIPGDNVTHTSQSVSVAGCTGTMTWEALSGTSTGTDLRMHVGYFEVTSGTASGAPVYTATASVSGFSAAQVEFVRIRAFTSGNQTISGGIATETDSGLTGTVAFGGVSVSGGLTTEADSALAGTTVPTFTASGGIATETESALAGSLVFGAVTVVGGIATETDSALAGSVTAGQVISGGIATETNTGLAGSLVFGAITVSGGLATETDSALAGSVSATQVIAGGIATETDTALAGTVVAPQVIVGGLASETNTALTGSVFIVYTTTTETTNSANGRERSGYFELIVEYATTATPASQPKIRTFAQSVPEQTMVDGRPA